MLDTDDPSVRPWSGGTALMLMMKSGVFEPSVLVDLTGVEEEHASIRRLEDGGTSIGALATLASLQFDPHLASEAPVLGQALPRLANVRVRNVARVGGCLAHGDPHMDLPPKGTDRVTFTPAGVVRTITMVSGRYDSLLVELPAALVQRVCRTNRRTAWRSASSEHNAKLALAARWYAEQACEDAEEDALLVRLLARTVARNFSTIRFRADDAWLAPSTLSRIARLATANHRACLPALAQEAGLSVSAFSRAFRGAIGLTAGDWLIERRITAAERMLIETDLPLTEVARTVGIRAASHFSQTFLARRGMPPSEFRRRARGQTSRVSGSSTPGEYRRLGR